MLRRDGLGFSAQQSCPLPLFELGLVEGSTLSRAALQMAGIPLGDLLARHQRGNWGQLDEIDRRQNELGVRMGLRIRSAYSIFRGIPADPLRSPLTSTVSRIETVWIVTAPDRLRTSVFLPREIFDGHTP